MGSPGVLRPSAEAPEAEAAVPKGTQKGKGSRKGKAPQGQRTGRNSRGRRSGRGRSNEPGLDGAGTASAEENRARAAAAQAWTRRDETGSDGARPGGARARSPPPRLQSPAVVRPRLRPPANPLLVGPPSPGGTRRVRFGPCAASPSPEGRARAPRRPGSPHPGAPPRGAALRPRAAEAPASPHREGGEVECPAQ